MALFYKRVCLFLIQRTHLFIHFQSTLSARDYTMRMKRSERQEGRNIYIFLLSIFLSFPGKASSPFSYFTWNIMILFQMFLNFSNLYLFPLTMFFNISSITNVHVPLSSQPSSKDDIFQVFPLPVLFAFSNSLSNYFSDVCIKFSLTSLQI